MYLKGKTHKENNLSAKLVLQCLSMEEPPVYAHNGT